MSTAIAKREINIFTSSQNVDKQVVERVEQLIKVLKKYKPNKKMQEAGFNTSAWIWLKNTNIDTIMYLVDVYGFTYRINGNGSVYIEAKYEAMHGSIRIDADGIKINLLPNDVKQRILIG
jgi:membrane-bound ClpP family serine protease